MAQGFAINMPGSGGLLVDTVSPTRRAAIVNWLIAHKHVAVTADRDDAWIEFMWRHLRGDRTFCVKVDIATVQGASANVTDVAA